MVILSCLHTMLLCCQVGLERSHQYLMQASECLSQAINIALDRQLKVQQRSLFYAIMTVLFQLDDKMSCLEKSLSGIFPEFLFSACSGMDPLYLWVFCRHLVCKKPTPLIHKRSIAEQAEHENSGATAWRLFGLCPKPAGCSTFLSFSPCPFSCSTRWL